MPGITWFEAQSLVTPIDDDPWPLFDGSTINGFVPIPEECEVGINVRATTDDVPQGFGRILHKRYLGGYIIRPTYQLWDNGAVALGATRREMYESLVLRLQAIFNVPGRYVWTPEGAGDDRIFERAQLLEWPNPQVATNPLKKVTFALDSPFPYAVDFTQSEVNVAGSGTVTNPGDVNFWPVIRVNGAFSSFTLTNLSVVDEDGNALQIVYDDSLPGADDVDSGHYAEITTFGGGKVYLDGNSSNLSSGIDVLASDFFPLAPGDNSIVLTGADSADFLVNGAWAL